MATGTKRTLKLAFADIYAYNRSHNNSAAKSVQIDVLLLAKDSVYKLAADEHDNWHQINLWIALQTPVGSILLGD